MTEQAYKRHFSARPSSFAAAERAIDASTHATLANLGWRIRSRVDQGYRLAPKDTHTPIRDVDMEPQPEMMKIKRDWTESESVSSSSSFATTVDGGDSEAQRTLKPLPKRTFTKSHSAPTHPHLIARPLDTKHHSQPAALPNNNGDAGAGAGGEQWTQFNFSEWTCKTDF